MKSYDYYNAVSVWAKVLPDGLAFCHWGGREQSSRLITKLELKTKERVLDICCGFCGTLSMINQDVILYGLDLSPDAINGARDYLRRHSTTTVKLVNGNAFAMPFLDNYFDKLFAQDPDSFLSLRKEEMMREITRVSKRRATFILQTYASTSKLTTRDKEEIDRILKEIGYENTETIELEKVEHLFSRADFNIEEIESLHSVYSKDNLRMIKLAKEKKVNRKILESLEFERYLFEKKAWTGIMVKGIKRR